MLIKNIGSNRKTQLFFICLLVTGNICNQAVAGSSSDALLKAINETKVYKLTTKEERCPSIIQLEADAEHFKYNPEDKPKDGEVGFRAAGYEYRNGTISTEQFVHENNYFVFRPNLKDGENKNLDWQLHFVLGYAYNSKNQSTSKENITLERNVNILSLAMIAKTNASFKFSSVNNDIDYTFKGNGISDVICHYVLAPELAPDIENYKALTKMNSEKLNEKVDSTARANKKENTDKDMQTNSESAVVIQK